MKTNWTINYLLGVSIGILFGLTGCQENKNGNSTVTSPYDNITSPYIVFTSDTHISAPEGRWPETTTQFQNFLMGLKSNPPDLIFIVGDIIDNAVNTPQGIIAGDNTHWRKEIKIYQSFIDFFAPIQFLQTLGPGHDYGNLTLAEKEIGGRKGVFHWENFQLIWLTVNSAAFSNESSANYNDALPSADYLWLAEQLKTSTNAILLFHVPLRTEITFEAGQWPNNRNLTIDYRDSLYPIIDQYSEKIVAIFNGHIHRSIQTKYRNIPLYICPFISAGCHCVLSVPEKRLKVQQIDCPKEKSL